MNRDRLLVGAVIAAAYLLLAVVHVRAFLFLSLTALWFALYSGGRSVVRWWRLRLFRQRAQFVSEIRRVDYFRRVPGPQLENWLLAAFAARGFVSLGDPLLERSLGDGFVWRSGKKAVLFIQQERPLTPGDLASIWALKNKCRVETTFVFSPFSRAPKSDLPGLEIMAGRDFLSWMNALDGVRPLSIDTVAPENCSCGAVMEEYLSRAGKPLLICSRHPDCQEAPRPGLGEAASVVA